MRHRFLLLTLLLTASTAAAEEDGKLSEGLGLLGEGGKLIMDGLLQELTPLLEDTEAIGESVAPLLNQFRDQLSTMIDDLNLYHPPEILPNGDIILRRKQPLDPSSGTSEIEI